MTSRSRLGVLGGTFDPPHNGHLALAGAALSQLDLDRVLWVPAGTPPHKPDRPVTPAHPRVAMIEAAIAGVAPFVISSVDLNRPGPHYTVDTLALLQDQHPGATLFFLMGGDSLAEFLTWRDPAGIVRQAHLAVMRRPGQRPDLTALRQVIPQIDRRLVWLDVDRLDVSSTELRRQVRQGRSIQGQIPPAVATYVQSHQLYRAEHSVCPERTC